MFWKHIPPGTAVVILQRGKERRILRWKTGGSIFLWPWLRSETLSLSAWSIEIDSSKPPLFLADGGLIRFTFAVGSNEALLDKAVHFFSDYTATSIKSICLHRIKRVLEGFSSANLQDDRLKFESALLEAVVLEAKAMGLVLVSANLDGIFGDAPKIRVTAG